MTHAVASIRTILTTHIVALCLGFAVGFLAGAVYFHATSPVIDHD